MNGPHDTWVRRIVTIIAAAIVLQLVVAALRPLIPYIVSVLALIGLVALVKWWRDRW
jgi:hypothetical protein